MVQDASHGLAVDVELLGESGDGGAGSVSVADLVDIAGEEPADPVRQRCRGTLRCGFGAGELDQEKLDGFG